MNQSPVFHVKDHLRGGLSHSDAIDSCLQAANAVSGEKTIVFDGPDYWINRAIILSSDTAVLINDCAICQKDEVFDNIFRGDNCEIHPENPYGFLLSVSLLQNIKIKGTGKNYLYPSQPYSSIYPEDNGDIHDVTISDVHTGGLHHGVICLAAEGADVTVENLVQNNPDGILIKE